MGLVSDKSNLAAVALKLFNPLTSMILLYRESLLYLNWPSLNLLLFAVGNSFGILIIGYFVFQKLSPNFAKEI